MFINCIDILVMRISKNMIFLRVFVTSVEIKSF